MLTGRTKAIASEFAPPAHSEPDVIEIADRERRRLGRELHDGLCQSLAGIAALTAALSRDLAANVADPNYCGEWNITGYTGELKANKTYTGYVASWAGSADPGIVATGVELRSRDATVTWK